MRPDTLVRHMKSQAGRAVPNQFILEHAGYTWFQSYDTVIAFLGPDGVVLDPNWNCSVTTSRWRARFLGESTKETRRKIADGTYTVRSLNGDPR